MRDDDLARALDQRRWNRSSVSLYPALALHQKGVSPVRGSDVNTIYGPLMHYTSWHRFVYLRRTGSIGGSHGCWLTPTPYAACMVPYNLGIDTPRDICLLVDVRSLDLWGPGTSGPSIQHPRLWYGGAIEFYSPLPIDFGYVVAVHEIMPCGDRHL